MRSLLRRKTITETPPEHQLARTLSWPHLVALGVGAIVGTGILTLIGVASDRAGPAVLLSFVVAGAIYLALNFLASAVFILLERSLHAHLAHRRA